MTARMFALESFLLEQRVRPIVHQHTWEMVQQLAERAQVPEWKVMHLALVLLEQTVRERPMVLELLHSVGGDMGPVGTGGPLPRVIGDA